MWSVPRLCRISCNRMPTLSHRTQVQVNQNKSFTLRYLAYKRLINTLAIKKTAKTFVKNIAFYIFIALLPLSFGLTQEANRISTAEAAKLGVGQNIGFIERLIHESVAAKQILESDNKDAHSLREKALRHLQEARDAEVRGDRKATETSLREAKQAIFKAMHLVGKNVIADNKKEKYQKKSKGLKALFNAHQRIVDEKNKGGTTKDLERYVQSKLAEANTEYDKGNYTKALKLLDSAYMSVKLSLTKLRQGETLVRSLHFDTKEDEYRYELNRNDTHKMLVNTVLKEKRADPRFGKLMDIPMNQAEQLRRQAKTEAESGNFKSAIKTMEQSTQKIIRAIRMAGIFIPG